MEQSALRAAVVYISPAGTTRRVSQVFIQALKGAGWRVEMFDLASKERWNYPALIEKAVGEQGCLFVGSPVYVDRALPPVTDLLRQLAQSRGSYAIPFVTWGGVNSGVALLELAQQLEVKGYRLLGAAKIMAVHSILLHCEHPLGEGHPDIEDESLIQEMVRGLTLKLHSDNPRMVSLLDLHYQPRERELEAWSASLDIAKEKTLAMELDMMLCSRCGICREQCPVQAIKMDIFVEISSACIRCLNCVRVCPEEAIRVDLIGLEKRIRKRVDEYQEMPPSQIFL